MLCAAIWSPDSDQKSSYCASTTELRGCLRKCITRCPRETLFLTIHARHAGCRLTDVMTLSSDPSNEGIGAMANA